MTRTLGSVFLFWACILSGLLATPVAAQPGPPPRAELQLVSDVWPPFTNSVGQLRVAVDLVQKALQHAGIASNTRIEEDFGQVMEALRSGGADGSVALWRNEERERYLLFSQPYLENRLVLLARKPLTVDVASLSQLEGKRVAIVASYAYGEELERTQGPVFVRGESDDQNVQRLIRGEVDYVLADELLIRELFDHYGKRAETLLHAGKIPMVERALHFAVRKDVPNAAAIVRDFDAAIQQMIGDGTYNRVLGMTWIRADVDGDGKSELILAGSKAGLEAPPHSYEVFITETRRAQSGTGYVIEGSRYERWQDVPKRYQVPVDPSPTGIRPGIKVFEF